MADRKTTESPVYRAALAAADTLARNGRKAYFVGGFTRDMLLGSAPHDIDIGTDAPPGEVAEIFPKSVLVGASFGVVTVIQDGFSFEVATLREDRGILDGRHPEAVGFTDNPKVDAARRDFTINGMFWDPVREEILDFFGGRDDLRRGVLRTIGNPRERFAEDYLRMLRAVRFAARLGFGIDRETFDAAREMRDKAASLSAERTRDELTKMFCGAHPARALETLEETGLLGVVLPEVAALKGVTQPEKFHPEGDVFVHTALMLERMTCPSPDLAWAVLLHDIGKPESQTFDGGGTEHFYCHDRLGAETARKILERLKFSNRSVENICSAVANHMKFAFATEMKASKWRRMMADPNFPLELELHRVDCAASHGRLDNFVFFLDKIKESENEVKLPPPLISGRDLIAAGMNPGPRMGEILREVADMRLEGIVSTKEEALAAAMRLAQTHSPAGPAAASSAGPSIS